MYSKYFKYTLSNGLGAEIEVLPRFDQNLQYKAAKQPQNEFFIEELNGGIVLVGNDFDFVNSKPINTKFTFSAYRFGVLRWQGYFHKSDCTIDFGYKQLSVKPLPLNDYTEIIANADKEIDLSRLGIRTYPVLSKIQAVIQIYILGRDNIVNFVGQNNWEQPINAITEDIAELENTYHFHHQVRFFLPGPGLNPDASGEYTYFSNLDEYYNGDYTIKFNATNNRWEIDLGGGVIFEGTTGQSNVFDTVFTRVAGTKQTKLHRLDVLTRVLTNVETLNSEPTLLLPVDDVIPRNRYTRAYPLDTANIIFSDNIVALPTSYGKPDPACENIDSENLFFSYPLNVPSGEIAFPINRTEWRCYSVWFHFDTSLRGIQKDGAVDDTIDRAWRLDDLMNAIFAEYDENISYDEINSFHESQNAIDQTDFTYFVTTRSSVLFENYERPEIRYTTTLNRIFKAFWLMQKQRWFIEDSKFQFQHVSFFRNGRTYADPIVGLDLSVLNESQNQKPWVTLQTEIKYRKTDMPEQIVTEWGEDLSRLFRLGTIDIENEYIQRGLIETDTIEQFITDIDFMHVSPGEVNPEGFVILATKLEAQSVYRVQFTSFEFEAVNYNVQNGALSLVYLLKNFHRYEMPAKDIRLNGELTTALSTKPIAEQSINYSDARKINPLELVKTNYSTGEIEEILDGVETNTKDLKIAYANEP